MPRRTGTVRTVRTPQQRRARRAFTPFHAPSRPPPGTYDPSLDAGERASGRGLADLAADIGPGGRMVERATSDYGLGLAAIDKGVARATSDHTTQTNLLGRQYGLLREAQGGQQAAQGVEQGGTVLAAALRRRENQGIEQGGLDTTFSRYKEDASQQKGLLGLSYKRQNEDFATQFARAGRENTQFGLDTAEQRFYQAKLGGYKPPTAPGNEHERGGLTYRVRGQGQGRKYTLPNGRQVSRDEWVNLWRWRRAMLANGSPAGANAPFAALGVGEGQLSG